MLIHVFWLIGHLPTLVEATAVPNCTFVRFQYIRMWVAIERRWRLAIVSILFLEWISAMTNSQARKSGLNPVVPHQAQIFVFQIVAVVHEQTGIVFEPHQ